MARYVLKPCSVRGTRIVVSRNESDLVLTWAELCVKLAPSKSPRALSILSVLTPSSFVGVVRTPRGPGLFLYADPQRKGNLRPLVKKDAGFPSRVLEVYWVDSVTEESSLVELT